MHPFELIYVPFPPNVHGFVHGATTKRDDGKYIVMVDSTLSKPVRDRAIRHELSHVLLGHLERPDADIGTIEDEADQHADQMTDDELQYLMTFATRTRTMEGVPT